MRPPRGLFNAARHAAWPRVGGYLSGRLKHPRPHGRYGIRDSPDGRLTAVTVVSDRSVSGALGRAAGGRAGGRREGGGAELGAHKKRPSSPAEPAVTASRHGLGARPRKIRKGTRAPSSVRRVSPEPRICSRPATRESSDLVLAEPLAPGVSVTTFFFLRSPARFC